MGLYAYCVVPAGYAPHGVVGIDGSAVTCFDWSDLGCWVSTLVQRPEPALDRIRAHDAVIQAAITEDLTPVPIRFGQWLDSTAALQDHLQLNAGRYTTLLKRFAGALEFGLRVLDPNRSARVPAPPETTSGTAYLTALRDQLRGAELDEPDIAEVRGALHAEFQGLVRDELFEPLRTPHGVLSVMHLVERAAFDEYRARLARVRGARPQLRFLASGPWPPYSFAA
jgi:hypothetical protein